MRVKVHVDGSYRPDTDRVAWCFVVFTIDSDGQEWYGGFHIGNVIADSSYGDFLGAASVSSDVAEVHGLA